MNEDVQNAYVAWLTGSSNVPGGLDDEVLVVLRDVLSTRSRKAIIRLSYGKPSRPVTIRDLVCGEPRLSTKGDYPVFLGDMKNIGAIGLQEISDHLSRFCGRPLHPLHAKPKGE